MYGPGAGDIKGLYSGRFVLISVVGRTLFGIECVFLLSFILICVVLEDRGAPGLLYWFLYLTCLFSCCCLLVFLLATL